VASKERPNTFFDPQWTASIRCYSIYQVSCLVGRGCPFASRFYPIITVNTIFCRYLDTRKFYVHINNYAFVPLFFIVVFIIL
jgi:hypothetical protein